jgi:ubiquinone biosynthesis protein
VAALGWRRLNSKHRQPEGNAMESIKSSYSNHLPVRDIPRLARILQVAAENGWGRYVERLRLKGYLPKGDIKDGSAGLNDAQRLRVALEALGPTFVKFGQMLSVRHDLFSEDVIGELQKLQDAVPPFPVAQARQIIEAELERPVAEIFTGFEDVPLAAASIAQVHVATLPDGTAAIVKVQRPGIEKVIQSDLQILFLIARLLDNHVPESRRYDPRGLVEEFSETILRELDFLLEAQNADRFRENFKNEPAVYVPQVFWGLCAKRVLTMALSHGHKTGSGFPADPAERQRLAGGVARLFLVQLFEHGFFHGDPHPANVFIMDDGRLCFHDFGIVGRLSPRDQENLRQLFLALIVKDAEWMAEVYFEMGAAAASVDREAFVRDLNESLEQYYAAAAHAYSFAEMLHQFIRLGQRHQIRVPRQLLLVAKAFMAVESLARSLDPSFNMIAAMRDHVPQMIGRQLAPELDMTAVLAKGYRMMNTLRTGFSAFPEIFTKGLRQLQTGEAILRLRHERLEGLEQHIDRASNRLSFSLIIAAIVVGSSIVMSFHTGPHYQGIPVLGLFGYVLASFLGLWWAVAILRSGKF